MGTFLGVCAISQLPIMGGEPVVVVAVKDPPNLLWDNGFCTYGLAQQISHTFSRYAKMDTMDTTAWRAYFNDGESLTSERLEELIAFTRFNRQYEFDSVIEQVLIVPGFYDEVGGVVDQNGKNKWEPPTLYGPHAKSWFMVKRPIWDALTQDVTPCIADYYGTYPLAAVYLPWLQLHRLAWECFAANIELVTWYGFYSNDIGSFLKASAKIKAITIPARQKLVEWWGERVYEENDEDASEISFAYW